MGEGSLTYMRNALRVFLGINNALQRTALFIDGIVLAPGVLSQVT